MEAHKLSNSQIVRKSPGKQFQSFSHHTNATEGGKQSLMAHTSKPVKQGVLKKWTNVVKGFQKRFFVLDQELLSYYKDEKHSVLEKGQVSLRLAKIDPKGANEKKIIIYTGTTELFLKFHSLQEKQEWLQAIQQVQSKFIPAAEKNQEIMAFEDHEKILQQEQMKREDMDREIKEALNIALSKNILKENSLLSLYVADTWAAHNNLEQALEGLKTEVQKQRNSNPNLVKVGEQIESSSNDLKQSITNAVKQIEETKIQIIKILQKQDEYFQQSVKLTKSKNNDEQQEMSFSQDFISQMERGNKMGKSGTIYKDARNTLNIEEEKKRYEEDDNDEFYDAEENIEDLRKHQSQLKSLDEESIQSAREEEYRTILPSLRPPDEKFSVWKVIKDAVGKDLSKFCVPVYFNEPISMVQKVSEAMEYEDLLCKANDSKDQFKRLLYVTAFGIAQYKCSNKRLNKPFNPILGETYEMKRPNFQYIAEQVSHHPPISAGFAESEKYELWMNSFMKTQFWGKSLEVKPMGLINVRLKSTNEHITIDRPNSSVNNLIFGDMYVEHYGKMVVKNYGNNDICEIEFKKRGWSGKNAFEVEGYVYQQGSKDKKYKIWGKWTENLDIKNMMTGEEERIWTANPMPPESNRMYHFTYFTLQLNHLPTGLRQWLPPTDSRLRPDQRALEEGQLELATSEKLRLEEKQRDMRKQREQAKIEYECKYFEEYTDPDSGEKGYKYGKRDYWNDRKTKNWSHLEEIF